jgi:1-acyl-sn-glycerol-3-phosphate acyltransferase
MFSFRLIGILFVNFIILLILCFFTLWAKYVNKKQGDIVHKRTFDLGMKILSFCILGSKGSRMRTHIPPNLPSGPVVVICNHYSGMDVWLIMIFMHRYYGDFRFVLKNTLKWVPCFGWYTYLMDYPFTKRARFSDLKKDSKLIKKEKNSIAESVSKADHKPLAWCCFPEGARYHKNNTRSFKEVQDPKTGAILQCIQSLGPGTVNVLDITIGYRTKPYSVFNLLSMTKCMGSLWIKVFEVDASIDRKALKGILFNIWGEKELCLIDYYKKEKG